ncbi:MAG: hypothetical protein R3F10_04950 [Lysobacteraceae bacterium]
MNHLSLTKPLLFLIGLCASLCVSAQQHNPQAFRADIQQAAQIVQTKYSTSQSMLSIAEMAGSAQEYQLAQYEMQYHHQIYDYLTRLSQQPATLNDPGAYQAYRNTMWEYYYRTDQRDYRPQQQIAANLRAYVSQRQWESSTPEGQRAYEARRTGNQAAFDAHQRGMAEMRAIQDRNHDSYMEQLRNTPTRSAGSGYDSHDAYIDSIRGTTSFQDPYSETRVSKDGQYDYWYQDNLGNYHGTNDPNFSPYNNLPPGNWERTEPLTPNRHP